MRASSRTFWHCCGIETRTSSSAEMRASSSASWFCSDAETRALSPASFLRNDAEAWVLSLASWHCVNDFYQPCVWSMGYTSDDLSSVIFRQSIEPPPKFSKLCGWLEWVSKHFGLSFWQQSLKTELATFWDSFGSTLSGFWSLWVYC